MRSSLPKKLHPQKPSMFISYQPEEGMSQDELTYLLNAEHENA